MLDNAAPQRRNPTTGAPHPRLPRKKLGRGTRALLVLLRVYVLIAIPIVAYAFIRALPPPHP